MAVLCKALTFKSYGENLKAVEGEVDRTLISEYGCGLSERLKQLEIVDGKTTMFVRKLSRRRIIINLDL